MTDTTPTPVVVSANAGLIDSLQAAGRYVVVLIAAGTAVATLVKAHDAAGLITYAQQNGGQVLGAISGLIAIGTAAYGIFKSHKRGAQVATVAAADDVPDAVAHLK